MEGWDSADLIATRCGLNDRGIASRWAQDFLRSSRTALGPTLPPVRRDISDSVRTKSYGERYGCGKIFFHRNASVFLYHMLFHKCCVLNLI